VSFIFEGTVVTIAEMPAGRRPYTFSAVEIDCGTVTLSVPLMRLEDQAR